MRFFCENLRFCAKICGFSAVSCTLSQEAKRGVLHASVHNGAFFGHFPYFDLFFCRFFVRFCTFFYSESASTGVWCIPGLGAGFEIVLEPSKLQKERENPAKGHFLFSAPNSGMHQTLVEKRSDFSCQNWAAKRATSCREVRTNVQKPLLCNSPFNYTHFCVSLIEGWFPPTIGCKISWPFSSRKPPALTSTNRRKSATNPEITSVNVC